MLFVPRMVAGLMAVGAVLSSAPTFAQQKPFPSRQVTIIVPFPAGGATDLVTRILGEKFRALWDVPVLIENRGGAGGSIGVSAAARAEPDGYRLVMGAIGTHGISPALDPALPYNAVSDFEPICLVASTQSVLVVHPSVAAKNVEELIAYAKANPGQLLFGSAGKGTSQHMAGEMFNYLAKIKTTHVPYRGTAEMLVDLVAGRVQMDFEPLSTILPHLQAGNVRALAVTGAKRSSEYPDLPTMAEIGLSDFNMESWYGLLAPAKTPKAVVDKVSADCVSVVKSPDVDAKLKQIGTPGIGSGSQGLADHIANEIKKWTNVVKASGATPN